MKVTMSGRIGALKTAGNLICAWVDSFFSLYTLTSGRAAIVLKLIFRIRLDRNLRIPLPIELEFNQLL